MLLSEKVCIITGAASLRGIGRATARLLSTTGLLYAAARGLLPATSARLGAGALAGQRLGPRPLGLRAR